jgi:hypothetical protein
MEPSRESALVLRSLCLHSLMQMRLSGGNPSSAVRFLRAGRYYQKLLLQNSQVIGKVEI